MNFVNKLQALSGFTWHSTVLQHNWTLTILHKNWCCNISPSRFNCFNLVGQFFNKLQLKTNQKEFKKSGHGANMFAKFCHSLRWCVNLTLVFHRIPKEKNKTYLTQNTATLTTRVLSSKPPYFSYRPNSSIHSITKITNTNVCTQKHSLKYLPAGPANLFSWSISGLQYRCCGNPSLGPVLSPTISALPFPTVWLMELSFPGEGSLLTGTIAIKLELNRCLRKIA